MMIDTHRYNNLKKWLLVVAIAALLFAILISSKFKPSGAFIDPRFFAGYYESGGGDELHLAEQGELIINSDAVGKYSVVAPVGGKHGYLIRVQGLKLTVINNKIVAKAGGDGFSWPVAANGSITAIFTPDYMIALSKVPC